jgi:hypothetical protein
MNRLHPNQRQAALRAALHDELATIRALNESLRLLPPATEYTTLMEARSTALELVRDTLLQLYPRKENQDAT